MEDFCALAQGSASVQQKSQRHLFHCIDLVFRPKNAVITTQKELNSVKNLLKGGAAWTMDKNMLGWLVDLLHYIISLPSARLTKVHNIMYLFTFTQQHTSKPRWHRLLGTLKSLVIDIPGGASLF